MGVRYKYGYVKVYALGLYLPTSMLPDAKGVPGLAPNEVKKGEEGE